MVDLSASTIILEYVCPGLGVIICQFMFSAPLPELRHALTKGGVGVVGVGGGGGGSNSSSGGSSHGQHVEKALNPTPWAFMLGNCFGWVTYGILTQNLFIYWANAPGFCLSVYYNLSAVKLLSQGHCSTEMRKSLAVFLQEQEEAEERQERCDNGEIITLRRRISNIQDGGPAAKEPGDAIDWATIIWNVTSQTTPAPAPHETLVLIVVILWMSCISLLGFAQQSVLDSTTRERIVGYMVNLNLIFFYGAPLSIICTVLRQGDSSNIHRRTLITNTLNGTFWLAYGLAVMDPFVYVPNGLGALLGAIQGVLILWYPASSSASVVVAANKLMVASIIEPEMETDTTGKEILEMVIEGHETTLPLTATNGNVLDKEDI